MENVEIRPYPAIKYIATCITCEIVFFGEKYWLKEEMMVSSGSLWKLFKDEYTYMFHAMDANDAVELAVKHLSDGQEV